MKTNAARVLIVDDEKDICDLLSEELKELGYLCEIAEDGKSALQKMAKRKFDIALLDIRLPGISGIELLEKINAEHNLAVIMITAINDVNTAVESMKLGAFDYIVKPFDFDTLGSRIRAALEKRERLLSKTTTSLLNEIDGEEKELLEMDAIAKGIEVKLDLDDKRSTTVTLKTIDTAKEMGIPEECIIQWVIKRAEINSKNLELLKRFSQSAIAQAKMGMAPKYQYKGNLYKSDN